MGQRPQHVHLPTQRIQPAYFRSDPHQPTVMLDVGAYMARAAGTTPPIPGPPRQRVGLALFATMLAMTSLAIMSRATYWFLIDTESGRTFLDRLAAVITAPL